MIAPIDPVPTSTRRVMTLKRITEKQAQTVTDALAVSARALRLGMDRKAIVHIWRARGVGRLVAEAIVPEST